MNKTEMTIYEKFDFSDGRTVFAVLPESGIADNISKLFDLIINDEKIARIKIEEEMLVENQGRSPYMAISTLDTSKLKNLKFEAGKWKLRLA